MDIFENEMEATSTIVATCLIFLFFLQFNVYEPLPSTMLQFCYLGAFFATFFSVWGGLLVLHYVRGFFTMWGPFCYFFSPYYVDFLSLWGGGGFIGLAPPPLTKFLWAPMSRNPNHWTTKADTFYF